MKRNTFFRTITLGVAGLGLQSSFAAVPFFQGTSVMQWITQLRTALMVKHRPRAKFSAENFSFQVGQQNVFLEQLGFAAGNTSFCFFGAQETYCFYPVLQRNVSSGITEILLPVFFRNNEGVWSHQKTLNGFQIEALCRAAEALRELPEPLFHILMPVSGSLNANLPNKYQTLDGTVNITTKVLDGKVQTRCVVKGREGLLFDETFTSHHCLS